MAINCIQGQSIVIKATRGEPSPAASVAPDPSSHPDSLIVGDSHADWLASLKLTWAMTPSSDAPRLATVAQEGSGGGGDPTSPRPLPPPMPQKGHALHRHSGQCEPTCLTLQKGSHEAKLTSLASWGAHALATCARPHRAIGKQ